MWTHRLNPLTRPYPVDLPCQKGWLFWLNCYSMRFVLMTLYRGLCRYKGHKKVSSEGMTMRISPVIVMTLLTSALSAGVALADETPAVNTASPDAAQTNATDTEQA